MTIEELDKQNAERQEKLSRCREFLVNNPELLPGVSTYDLLKSVFLPSISLSNQWVGEDENKFYETYSALSIVRDLTKKGIQFISLTQNIDTTTSTGQLVFHIFCCLSQHERDVTRERTYAGLAAARARGRVGGRRYSLNDKQVEQMMILYNSHSMPVKEICKLFKITDRSLYNYKERLEAKKVA